MLTVLVSVNMLTKKEPIVENTDRLIFLIEKAASIVGSEYKLAKKMEIPQQNLSNWKSGSKTCPPAVRAILAGIAGENAADELIRATMEREEGTRRGLLLGELLGKRAARVVEESQATESPAHAALQAVVDQLDMTDEREREARAGILAVLGAFPEGDQDVKVKLYRKSFKTGNKPVFFRPCISSQILSITMRETSKCRTTAARVFPASSIARASAS